MNSIRAQKLVIAFAALVVAGLFCASGIAKLPPEVASPLTKSEKEAPFLSVARTGGYVVAMNSNGFYRTSFSKHDWQRLSVPRGMTPYRQFSVSEANSNVVYFCATTNSTNGCLYASKDAGATWKLVSDKYGFEVAHQNRDGRLYAIIWQNIPGSTNAIQTKLIMSENGGRAWKDISGNIFAQMLNLFSDPKHPNRICVGAWGIRAYVFEAVDDDYSKWTGNREWEWRTRLEKTDDDYLRNLDYYSGSGTIAYTLVANLQNYFDYDFGDSPYLPAFTIDVDTNHLEFSVGQKVQVPVAVNFRPDYGTVKLVDALNTAEFWGLQCLRPDGKRVYGLGQTNQVSEGNDSKKMKQRIDDDTGFGVFELSATHSYRRTVTLDKLADFSQPGTYRMRLEYTDQGWGWEGETQNGIWGRNFYSPIFIVTINP